MEITQAKLKELFHYDPDTGVFTHIKARQNVRAGSIAGYVTNFGYTSIGVDRKRYQAHRLAWLYMHGEFPPKQLDHINRVRTDNRLCNLRLANQAENLQNQPMRSTNTSGCIGVSWGKRDQKWLAQIMLNGKSIYLGCFTDLNEAIAARKAAELKYHTFQHA